MSDLLESPAFWVGIAGLVSGAGAVVKVCIDFFSKSLTDTVRQQQRIIDRLTKGNDKLEVAIDARQAELSAMLVDKMRAEAQCIVLTERMAMRDSEIAQLRGELIRLKGGGDVHA